MIRISERQTVKCAGCTSLFVSFDFNQRIVDELKLLSTYFFNADTREWEVPITCLSTIIDRCCLLDNIEITCLPTSSFVSEEVSLPTFKTNPFDYQLEGIRYGLTHDSWLLLDAPGLGKTLQILYIAQELRRRENIQHCLIICGVNTLKINWKKEIEKHTDLSCRILGERYTKRGNYVIEGVSERVKQLTEPINEFFVITNIETLRDDRIIQALRKSKINKFDMIVVDEIHVAKTPTSAQSKNLLKLFDAKYKIGATGTLLLNNPLDAYVPLKWIGAERATYTNFKYNYCTYGGPFGNEIIGYKNASVLKHQLDQVSLRRTKDILDLPPKTVINEYLEMSLPQSQFYSNIVSGIVDQVDKVHISTVNLLAMIARLRQATACPTILTSESIPSAKIDRAVELAQQLISNGEKVVIFSTFKDSVYEVGRRLQEYSPVYGTGNESDSLIAENIVRFQENAECKVFIGTWQKCGTGITLTAASYMIFLDTPWTSGVYEQAQDRIHRIGSKNPVFIYNLVCTNTIDERVVDIVEDKALIGEYIVDDKCSPQLAERLRQIIHDL